MTKIRLTWPEHMIGTIGEVIEDPGYGVAYVVFRGCHRWPVGHRLVIDSRGREVDAVAYHTDNFERI